MLAHFCGILCCFSACCQPFSSAQFNYAFVLPPFCSISLMFCGFCNHFSPLSSLIPTFPSLFQYFPHPQDHCHSNHLLLAHFTIACHCFLPDSQFPEFIYLLGTSNSYCRFKYSKICPNRNIHIYNLNPTSPLFIKIHMTIHTFS